MDRHGAEAINGNPQISELQTVDVNYDKPPVPCLRGGGADAKRKEARKRKFAGRDNGDSLFQEIEVEGLHNPKLEIQLSKKQKKSQAPRQLSKPLPEIAPVMSPKKKSKKSERSYQHSEPVPATDTEPASGGEAKPNSSTTQTDIPKSQRFIVFIGIPFPLGFPSRSCAH